MEQLLQKYSWPGNVWELRAVSTRYVITRAEQEHPTQIARYHFLVRAIGEDRLFRDLANSYPALTQKPIEDKKVFADAFLAVKEWMQYSNEQMAEKLEMGRTSLWRILREVEKTNDSKPGAAAEK